MLGRRSLLGIQLTDGAQRSLYLVVDVVRDQCHFLQDFLLVEELRKSLLQLQIQFAELGFRLLNLAPRGLPSLVLLIDLLVLLLDCLNESAQLL